MSNCLQVTGPNAGACSELHPSREETGERARDNKFPNSAGWVDTGTMIFTLWKVFPMTLKGYVKGNEGQH